ncbi:protein translocase subunit SecF [Haliovirga abyssi]|uniref:Protein-export membrane protein SecF n=1 Tax=Haliovirga abyssi TaxID=2996794 RepID=A0AAU9D489_9FUSO|nr:protein translocase subunit SecF [Haliovirga abyssi]BDU50779.1 protein-export membrane protein SecF [Haliovirga abyssi]
MNLKIIKNTKIWFTISITLVVAGLLLFMVKGLNYGIDFTGGTLFQLKFEKSVKLSDLNKDLKDMSAKYKELESKKIQISEGNVVLIRTNAFEEAQKDNFLNDFKAKEGKFEILKVDKVGATIGKELKWKAINALLIGSLLIVLYITIRFEFRFAVGAIVALLHDLIIAVGAIALLGYEINTPFIAAILTILGYSINDTIVVFDRIRENIKKKSKKNIGDLIDDSINQVFTRSINTSVTTLLAILAVLIFGGASLRTFITALLIGILSGTYSSIFVASPIVNLLEKKEAK